MAPPGNTPLPPLPGAGGVVHTGAASTNPWVAAGATPVPAAKTNRVEWITNLLRRLTRFTDIECNKICLVAERFVC